MNIVVSQEIFKDLISSSKEPVVAVFSAHWCAPCRTLKPIIEKISGEISNVSFVSIDIDELECRAISEEYNISSIPTILIFKNGKIISRSVGSSSRNSILSEIEKALAL